MHPVFKKIFAKYPVAGAPFMHQQYHDWQKSKPLQDLRIVHHVPVVQNCLLKIACLVAAGAEVTVTNPDFMQPCPLTLAALQELNIKFTANIRSLATEHFDIYYDCGATLYQTLGAPQIGAVELTGSGDTAYRKMSLACPVISIDRSLTKQLETIFGVAENAVEAITQFTASSLKNSAWVVFGFGKIGRGLAYLCARNGYSITVVDSNPAARLDAERLHIQAIDTLDHDAIDQALSSADVVMTATGGQDVLNAYPKSWFDGKILANMGIFDEFGPRFAPQEILYEKKPINFSLNDPTPIQYIDPEMYLHNQVSLDLLTVKPPNGIHTVNTELDNDTINRWCAYHAQTREDIERWFIQYEAA